MKKLLFFLLLSSCATFFSCGSDDDDTVADFLTATIDGSSYKASTVSGVSDNSGSEELVFLVGRNPDTGYSIGVNILETIETDVVYQIDANDLGLTFTDAANNAFFTDGQFTLTARDSESRVLEGTFSFTTTEYGNPSNVIEVTDGAFKITYL